LVKPRPEKTEFFVGERLDGLLDISDSSHRRAPSRLQQYRPGAILSNTQLRKKRSDLPRQSEHGIFIVDTFRGVARVLS
jgi:hypothetical protein